MKTLQSSSAWFSRLEKEGVGQETTYTKELYNKGVNRYTQVNADTAATVFFFRK